MGSRRYHLRLAPNSRRSGFTHWNNPNGTALCDGYNILPGSKRLKDACVNCLLLICTTSSRCQLSDVGLVQFLASRWGITQWRLRPQLSHPHSRRTSNSSQDLFLDVPSVRDTFHCLRQSLQFFFPAPQTLVTCLVTRTALRANARCICDKNCGL